MVEVLVSLLTADDVYWQNQAVQLLNQLEPETVIKSMTQAISPQPENALTVCHKVMNRQPLNSDDGKILAEFLHIHPEDNAAQGKAQSWLFDWLTKRLMPKE